MTRVLIADDHPVFRAGLRSLLEGEGDFTVCGDAADGAEALRKLRLLRPDLLLLDVSMPGVDGLEALRDLSDEDRATRILLLTAAIDQDPLVRALQLGARGVVLKDVPTGLLLKAIRAVAAGEFWVGRECVASLVEALRPRVRHDGSLHAGDHGLTDRELVIVSGVVGAFSNRDIADRLSISEKTVKHHLTNVFDKLGVSTRTELAMFAVRHRLPFPEFPPR